MEKNNLLSSYLILLGGRLKRSIVVWPQARTKLPCPCQPLGVLFKLFDSCESFIHQHLCCQCTDVGAGATSQGGYSADCSLTREARGFLKSQILHKSCLPVVSLALQPLFRATSPLCVCESFQDGHKTVQRKASSSGQVSCWWSTLPERFCLFTSLLLTRIE